MKTFFAQPLITEKSMAQATEGVYQFVVPTWVTKRQMADFISQHFGVTVADVNTTRIQGKRVSFRRRPGQQASFKKAIVSLKKGETIASFTMPVESETAPAPASEQEPAPTAEIPTESKITVRSKSKKRKSEE